MLKDTGYVLKMSVVREVALISHLMLRVHQCVCCHDIIYCVKFEHKKIWVKGKKDQVLESRNHRATRSKQHSLDAVLLQKGAADEHGEQSKGLSKDQNHRRIHGDERNSGQS